MFIFRILCLFIFCKHKQLPMVAQFFKGYASLEVTRPGEVATDLTFLTGLLCICSSSCNLPIPCQLRLKTLCTWSRNIKILIFFPNYADSRAHWNSERLEATTNYFVLETLYNGLKTLLNCS
jgi:hypothetical protein